MLFRRKEKCSATISRFLTEFSGFFIFFAETSSWKIWLRIKLNSRKMKRNIHPPLVFNNSSQSNSLKHLGVTLDSKLTFEEHVSNVLIQLAKP